jgi:hypothetical protein
MEEKIEEILRELGEHLSPQDKADLVFLAVLLCLVTFAILAIS